MTASGYNIVIAELDENIAAFREFWLCAAPKDKNRHMDRLNIVLDRRMWFMRLRDISRINERLAQMFDKKPKKPKTS